MSFRTPATSGDVGGITLSNHLDGTATAPQVVDHAAITSGDKHTEYTKADGTRAFTGNQSMGGNKLTNLGAPTSDNDAARKTYVDASIASAVAAAVASLEAAIAQQFAGFVWKDNVADLTDTPPGSPSTGDRYIVIATAAGAWAGHEQDIAEWDGSAWTFYTPATNDFTSVDAMSGGFYRFGGTEWEAWNPLADLAATAPISLSGGTLSLDLGHGLEVNSGSLRLKLDGATLARSADGIKLADDALDAYTKVDGSRDFTGNVLPQSTGLDLGSADQRWDVFGRNASFSGGFTGSVRIVTASTTVGETDHKIVANVPDTNEVTITLPACATGRELKVYKAGSGTGNVVVQRAGSDTIGGPSATSHTLTIPGQTQMFTGVGTIWALG